VLLLAAPVSAAHAERYSTRWSDALPTSFHLFRLWRNDQDATILVRDHLVSISSDLSALSFTLDGGKTLKLAFSGGRILLDDQPVGHVVPGGALEASWRQLVSDAARRTTPEVVSLVHGWQPVGLSREEHATWELLQKRLESLSAAPRTTAEPRAIPPALAGGFTIELTDLSDPEQLEPQLRKAASEAGGDLRLTVPGGQARLGNFSVGSGERLSGHLLVVKGTADIYGTIDGNLATVDGDVIIHRGAVVTGDVLALGGDVSAAGGEIRGEIRTVRPAPSLVRAPAPRAPSGSALATTLHNAAGLLGVFLTFLLLGFGLVLFGRHPLEVVSDTVNHSFARSFVVGLLAEVLLVPTFGMIVVGLILSVVGILLLPFAVVVYVLLAIAAVLGGAIAVAHAMGETVTRRRMALGIVIGSPNSYRYLLIGLSSVCALWAVWIIFGWVPVAGTIIFGLSALVTWLLGTVGLGATLMSRAGLREGFAGRILPQEALTDEYLWATPRYGVPAAKRPDPRTPPPLP
jgi:hypothetical protein